MVSYFLSLSLSPPTHTHAYAHTRILCRRKDHTLSQPVCEVQHQSCSLFRSSRLCNVVVRKTLIFGAAESALLHHRTILIVTMAFSIFTFHDKIFILHANDFSGKKKKNCLSLLSWCSVHLHVQIDCVYVQYHVLGYGGFL